MHAENFFVYKGTYGQTVKNIWKDLPESYRVPSFALIVEAVDSVDLGAFMVASKKEKVLRVLDLIAEQQRNSLNTLLSSVDVVSKEKVIRFRWESTILKQA